MVWTNAMLCSLWHVEEAFRGKKAYHTRQMASPSQSQLAGACVYLSVLNMGIHVSRKENSIEARHGASRHTQRLARGLSVYVLQRRRKLTWCGTDWAGPMAATASSSGVQVDLCKRAAQCAPYTNAAVVPV